MDEPGGAGVSSPAALPETVSLLFADIEGSTALLTALGDAYADALATYRDLLAGAVEANGGQVEGTEGDGLFATFPSGRGAITAAADAQQALARHEWPAGVAVRARMGVHTGEALRTPGGYVGLDVHRAARIAAAAHGGQVVLSEAARVVAGASLPGHLEVRELGAHRLKDLAEPVVLYELTVPGLPTEFPPLRSLDAVPNNLPTQLTSFVGREAEVARAVELLRGTRLLTLTGPGGTGKTRLSLQVAAAVADELADGVWFVPLAPISDPDLVASTILKALAVQESPSRTAHEQLLGHLADRELLLVLDNFEQVVEAAPLVTDILRGAPRVKALVSSRAALKVYGEQELPVPPLSVPDPDDLPPPEMLSRYESVSLFVERATAVNPDFSLTAVNGPVVAAICARLDGLPLAIELAAARTKLLTPDAILTRLEGRLTALGGGARDLPARQQTLRDAIGWSYDLLDEQTQRLFNRLSVFVGGCAVEDAERVCTDDALTVDVLDGLSALLDQSLLRRSEVNGEQRFWMLATIRDFAAEQLEASGEADEIRSRHASTYRALLEEAAPQLTGPDSKSWLDRLEAELDNLRAAQGWALDICDTELALRLPATAWRFFHMRAHLEEGRTVFAEALALPCAQELDPARAAALEAAGSLAYWAGDMVEAERLYQESLEVYRQIDDASGIARGLYNLSFALEFQGRVDDAIAALEDSLQRHTELGDRLGAAWVRWSWGYLAAIQGDIELARSHEHQALATFRELGDRFGIAWALHSLGQAELMDGRPDVAAPLFTEALQIFHEVEDHSGLVLLLDDFAMHAAVVGDPERSVRLQAAADERRRHSGTDVTGTLTGKLAPDYPDPTAGLTADVLDRLTGEGAAMSDDEAVAYALETFDSAGS